MKTLIITNSFDATTDILINNIGSNKIFRLNFDQYEENEITLKSSGISIKTNNSEISDKEIIKVLWRKPFNTELKVDNYVNLELKYIYREIFNYFNLLSKTILVTHNSENYKGKYIQAFLAKKYFNVPEFSIEINTNLGEGTCVAKSLSTALTDHNRVLFTTKVKRGDLNNKYPWYLQTLIHALLDVTVVFINQKLFAFELDRKSGLIDWRKEINKNEQVWRQHKLKPEIEEGIIAFMNDIKLNFGRLDFLVESEDYYFLEVNPNGQWAWLDLNNENGLLNEMINQISPDSHHFTSP